MAPSIRSLGIKAQPCSTMGPPKIARFFTVLREAIGEKIDAWRRLPSAPRAQRCAFSTSRYTNAGAPERDVPTITEFCARTAAVLRVRKEDMETVGVAWKNDHISSLLDTNPRLEFVWRGRARGPCDGGRYDGSTSCSGGSRRGRGSRWDRAVLVHGASLALEGGDRS